jgi:prevent-host-death family protein
MIHIVNITDVRQRLPQVLRELLDPVVIVQNSKPKGVLISYSDFLLWQKDTEEKEYLKMVKKSPSYKDDEDEPQNYNSKDLIPL